MYHVPSALQLIYGWSDEGGEDGDWKEGMSFKEGGREWRLLGLLYADYLVLCVEAEEDLRVIVEQFAKVSRRGLKFNVGKSKVMVLNGKEVLECEVHVDGIRLNYVS